MGTHPPSAWVSTTDRFAPVRAGELPKRAPLVAYDRYGGARLRRKGYPHRACRSLYTGDVVEVTSSDGHRVEVTPPTAMLARWSTRPGVGLYVMRSGDDWRIGTSTLHLDAQAYSFGPSRRAVENRADAMWVLDVFPTAVEARAAEREFSTDYGITQRMFRLYRTLRTLGRVPDVECRAVELLARFGQSPDTPMWTAGERTQRGCRASMALSAAQLVPGWMEVAVDVGASLPRWLPFDVRRSMYDGPVVTIHEPRYGWYVAGGLVVGGSS